MATPTATSARTALHTSVSLWDRNPVAANAFRTMLAVGLAWIVGYNLPGEASQYAYYAPLGAVIATTNNPGGSLRTALQAAAAIVLGGTAAAVADIFGDVDNFLPMAITVGLAVLLGAFRWLGPMGSWVPTAALFTLIFGNGELEFVGYYTGLILIGAAVAVLIAVVLPGQPVALAERDLDRLRYALSTRIEECIEGVDENERDEEGDGHERTGDQGSHEGERNADGDADADEDAPRDSADAEGRDDQRETRGAATTGGTETESTRQEDARSLEKMREDAEDPRKGRRPDLDQELSRARQSVAELRDARRKNQRAHQHAATIARAEDQLRTWEFAAAAMELVSAGRDLKGPRMPDLVREATTEALAALQELLDEWRLTKDQLDLRRMHAATARLDEAVNDPSTPASPTATAVLITMSKTLDMLSERELSHEEEEREEKEREEEEQEAQKQEREERKERKQEAKEQEKREKGRDKEQPPRGRDQPEQDDGQGRSTQDRSSR
ncbi:hypothetical protein ACQE98_00080 [Ornithinimicrobium sp. W1679]|uniref:hypothetical protein n=1 Tax=Ornithinimicrobium sp. W1679 TaxID=3418770 RepID=UPI003CEE7207